MRTTAVVAIAALAAQASAHGVITAITGANGVIMPGLSVKDGVPRDCASPGCGAEKDTSIIRDNGPPLGRTNGFGDVDAASAISNFMGGASNSTGATTAASTAAKTPATAATAKRGLLVRGLLNGLLGGGNNAAGASSGTTSTGTKTPDGTTESGVAAAAGKGATSGLPTAADDGTVTMNLHQVNQDGAGPFTASIDPTSGGTDASAFQEAAVTQNVPGIGIGGLSGAQTTDFPVKVQMPAGMTCSGTVGGATNVCIVKMQNSALAGPFGGSAAFTQTAAQKKRSLEYAMLSKRHFARGTFDQSE